MFSMSPLRTTSNNLKSIYNNFLYVIDIPTYMFLRLKPYPKSIEILIHVFIKNILLFWYNDAIDISVLTSKMLLCPYLIYFLIS